MGQQLSLRLRQVAGDIDVAEEGAAGRERQDAVHVAVVQRHVGHGEGRLVQQSNHVRCHGHQVARAEGRPVVSAQQADHVARHVPPAAGVPLHQEGIVSIHLAQHGPLLVRQAFQVGLYQNKRVDEHVIVRLHHEASVRTVVINPAQHSHCFAREVKMGVAEVSLNDVSVGGLFCVDQNLRRSTHPGPTQSEHSPKGNPRQKISGCPCFSQNPTPLEVVHCTVDDDQHVDGRIAADIGIVQHVVPQERMGPGVGCSVPHHAP